MGPRHKTEDVAAPAMRRGGPCQDCSHRGPRLRKVRSQAKTTDIHIPYRTGAMSLLLLPLLAEPCTALVLLWLRICLGGLGDPLPDRAVFGTRRLRVFVRTRLAVSCSRRGTTFFLSLGCGARAWCAFFCSASVRLSGRPQRFLSESPAQ